MKSRMQPPGYDLRPTILTVTCETCIFRIAGRWCRISPHLECQNIIMQCLPDRVPLPVKTGLDRVGAFLNAPRGFFLVYWQR